MTPTAGQFQQIYGAQIPMGMQITNITPHIQKVVSKKLFLKRRQIKVNKPEKFKKVIT